MYVLTWNLFHGRASPAAGRPLLVEFAETIASWEWDVALLQECPPWWPPAIAHASGASFRSALTSRNSLLRVRAAIGRRNPDLIASNGGGCNATLVRGPINDERTVELTRRPERRVALGVLVGDTWVVNLHASKEPKDRTRADIEVALSAWSDAARLVFAGDFNLVRPEVPLTHVGSNHVDHVYARGLAGTAEVLDAGNLSDHKPLRATTSALADRSP